MSLAADCSVATSAIDIASKLRNLSVLSTVKCLLQDRTEVEKYLRDTLSIKIPQQRIENEGRVFKSLGLIPLDYAYVDGLIQLYTSQLGGYYDPDKDYYAMASWMPDAMQMPIAVHELTHALQDQHYDLGKMIDPEHEVSDALMARSALIEGDATAVMTDYARKLGGQGSIANESSVSAFMMQNLAGAMLSSSLHEAPQALQAILIFPYVSGLNFAHHLLLKGGYKEIDKAFKKLPTTTEEILHPEIYFKGKKHYQDVPIPALPEEKGGKVGTLVFSDQIGEFVISTFLGSWVSPLEASKAASGWGGDRVALYEMPGTNLLDKDRFILIWSLYWDTEHDAEEFMSVLGTAYAKRFGRSRRGSANQHSFHEVEVGNVEVERKNSEVTVFIGKWGS